MKFLLCKMDSLAMFLIDEEDNDEHEYRYLRTERRKIRNS